ncbi:MAG TPA: GSU2403 family nucleotidyltransferase fold protein [Gemmatimonadaceae bacterium]|nr:GSU2403 family nucleotidyltransferase fold protein [Gemmatimonadaceae bacterium]
MPGAPDPLYVAARGVLLDAIGALSAHLDALVLVGAQAVYIHAGEADLAVAPFTTDADLAIDPRHLAPQPLLEVALVRADFRAARGQVGIWEASVNVEGIPRIVSVDLLVPDSLSGPGRRGARIPPHAKTAARKVSGLEASLVDHDVRTIAALDPRDDRRFELAVAGPSALLVAKVHKILDRVSVPDRRTDKDALDVLSLIEDSTDRRAAHTLRQAARERSV